MNSITITINGKTLAAEPGMTILTAAKAAGVPIPTLCAHEALKTKAACGLCLVEIEGETEPKLACVTKVKPGMSVVTDSPALFFRRKALIQEMFRQHTVDCHHCLRIGSTKAAHFDPKFCESCFFCDCVRDGFCQLQKLALAFGVDVLPFEIHEHDFGVDASTGSVIRNMDKCVRCRRCVEVCNSQGVGILRLRKTENGQTVRAKESLMADGCIRCGRCVELCPTGALFMAEHIDEIVYHAHRYGVETAALLSRDVIAPLEALYGEDFTFAQVAAALRKLGIDHVFDGAGAETLSRAEAEKLLDARLGTGRLLLTNSYAAQVFLQSRFPALAEEFAFYDSPLKCFADALRAQRPDAKLVFVCGENSAGAETAETGAVDYFVNPRELYRIFLRTGGAPAKRVPAEPETLSAPAPDGRYDALLMGHSWQLRGEALQTAVEKDGRQYRALICFNPLQAKKALEAGEDWDLIRVLA